MPDGRLDMNFLVDDPTEGEPCGPFDPELLLLTVESLQGSPIGLLSNFACHPTIMDGVSTEVSADFVSSMYSYLDHTLGGVNFFLQGAIGGWIQPEYESKTFESVDRRGRELGQAIETALQNSQNQYFIQETIMDISFNQYKRELGVQWIKSESGTTYLCPATSLRGLENPTEDDLRAICVNESENPHDE